MKIKYFKHILIFLLLLGSGTKIQAQELTKIAKEIMVKDTSSFRYFGRDCG